MRNFHSLADYPIPQTHPEYSSTRFAGPFKEYGKYGKLGEKNGWWSYYASGELINTILYVHGVARQKRDYFGGELSIVKNIKPNGHSETIKVGYKGQPKVATTRNTSLEADGIYQRDGLYREWDTKGNLFLKATFRKDILHGTVTFYYPSGKIKESCRFFNGKQHGHCRDYYESGNTKFSIKYIKGTPYGWCYYFSDKGERLAYASTYKGYPVGPAGERTALKHQANKMLTACFRMQTDAYIDKKIKLGEFLPQISSFYQRYTYSITRDVPLTAVPLCV